MTLRSIDWTTHLSQRVPEGVRADVDELVSALPADAGCLVTGSLVEGIGNRHSDIDLYVVQFAADAFARPTSIGIRQSRYVDCEYLTDQNIRRLSATMDATDAETLVGLSQRDFDRYYRIAIGVPVRAPEALAEVTRLCDRGRACARFADWADVRAYETAARAAVALALGRSQQAVVLLREAALWRASRVLAHAGEGYPSLKWTEVKAARRFGAGSLEYRDCLAGYLAEGGDPARDLARMREGVPTPAAALAVMADHNWQLGPTVRYVNDEGRQYLLLGKKSIIEVAGVVATLVAHLAGSGTWPEAVAELARDLSVPGDEVVAASFPYLRELAAAGYLVSGIEQEG